MSCFKFRSLVTKRNNNVDVMCYYVILALPGLDTHNQGHDIGQVAPISSRVTVCPAVCRQTVVLDSKSNSLTEFK